jgi:hypothetical protein
VKIYANLVEFATSSFLHFLHHSTFSVVSVCAMLSSPSTGSESNDALSSSTDEQNNPSSSSEPFHQQQQQSFPEIYRSTLTDVPPHNFGRSDMAESSYIKPWPSSSILGDADDDQSMYEYCYRKSESQDASPSASSGPGSGDILSDEDRERLGSIQRGENTAIVGWLKNLGNHRCHQAQKSHKGTYPEPTGSRLLRAQLF